MPHSDKDFTVSIRGELMKNKTIFLAILLPQLLGCTRTQEIVIDDRKINSQEYSKDLQDDKEILFKSNEILNNCIVILNEVIKNLKPNKQKMFMTFCGMMRV